MDESIEAMAGRWIARLDRAGASADDRRELEVWLAADPGHAAAYAAQAAVWARLLRMRRPGAKTEGDHRVGVQSFDRPRPASVPPRTHWPLYAAACFGACAVALAFLLISQSSVRVRHIATEVGGYRRAALSDGTIVELNTDTNLRVSITPSARQVVLLKGEASFHVVKDAARPFTVAVGGLKVQAMGTVFNVRRRKQEVEVLIVEGKVTVSSLDGNDGTDSAKAPPLVRARQLIVATTSGVVVRGVNESEVERELAWQHGMLSFRAATLEEAAAEFNRYNRRQLLVDPAIADLRIGGYFRARNVDGFVAVLEGEFQVVASSHGDDVWLAGASSR